MKKKFLVLAILPLLAWGVLFPNFSEAKGFDWFWGFPTPTGDIDQLATRLNTWFQNVANILGISVEEVKNFWAEGKTIKQLMDEKGISQEQVQAKIKENCLNQLKSQLQALVDKGVISQTQADKRFELIKKQIEKGKGCKMNLKGFYGTGMKRFYRGWGF